MTTTNISDVTGEIEDEQWICDTPRLWRIETGDRIIGTPATDEDIRTRPKFIFFGRVSTTSQAKTGLGFRKQLLNCRQKVAEAGGVMLHERYEGAVSGASEKLETLHTLIRQASESRAKLIVNDHERLARSNTRRTQLESFAKSMNVEIVYFLAIPEFLRPIMNAVAETEREYSRIRTRDAIKERKKTGRVTLAQARTVKPIPLGSALEGALRSQERRQYHRRENQEIIFDMLEQGKTPQQVIEFLRKRRPGAIVTLSMVQRMDSEGRKAGWVRNTSYMDQNDILESHGITPAILSQREEVRAQRVAIVRAERTVRVGRFIVGGGRAADVCSGSRPTEDEEGAIRNAVSAHRAWCKEVVESLANKTPLRQRQVKYSQEDGIHQGRNRFRKEYMVSDYHRLSEYTQADFELGVSQCPPGTRERALIYLSQMCAAGRVKLEFVPTQKHNQSALTFIENLARETQKMDEIVGARESHVQIT
jgi:DNA invertase Pin-like site-specific DNA recombinase